MPRPRGYPLFFLNSWPLGPLVGVRVAVGAALPGVIHMTYGATVLASAADYPALSALGLELELRTDTQFAAAYLGGHPFASIQRRRVIGEDHAPVWQAFGLDGQRFAHAATARGIVRLVTARAGQCAALRLRNVGGAA